MKWLESGNPSSSLWLVGEAPGRDEIDAGAPFVGASGRLLTELLGEAGFTRRDFFITNVCHEMPPGNEISAFFATKTAAKAEHLSDWGGRYPREPILAGLHRLNSLLREHHPSFILAFGNTALWALTSLWGIVKWRGSVLLVAQGATKLIPTFHPAAILREWSLRNIVLQDLRRARRESLFPEIRYPAWQFTIRPTSDQALNALSALQARLSDENKEPVWLSCDIETRKPQISCVGIAWDKLHAICIPLMDNKSPEGYWSAEEECLIVRALRDVLTHPKVRLIFQNGAYDLQYFVKQYGFLPRIADDTMLMQHVAFTGMRKGLDFIASLYCEYYRYWKDDGKEIAITGDEDKHWSYNCEDCVRTFECWEVLQRILKSFNLEKQYRFQMDDVFPIVLKMMLRGVRIDQDRKATVRHELNDFILKGQAWLRQVLGHDLNVRSTRQMQLLFYDDFRIPPVISRKTGNPTLDDEALDKIVQKQPVLRPLIQMIRDIRSAGVTISNVLDAPISSDGRARCTYNIAGTETLRLSSSEDPFGEGFNLQNLTKGNEE